MKRTKPFIKILFPEEHKKALEWGLSKFIKRLLMLTEANYRKLKRYMEELIEGQNV